MSHAWMPFYVSDYLGKTQRLSVAEHGAYLLLIMEYWQSGGLPDDDRQLARICRVTEKDWQRLRPAMTTFFHDGWHHERIDEELAKADRKHSARVEAGKTGGKAKASRVANAKPPPSKLDSNATSFALASSSQPPSKSSEPDGSAPLRVAPTDFPDIPAELDRTDTLDERTRLFREGLRRLMALTGKPEDKCRTLLGRWLKQSDDDARKLRRLIEDAERDRAADPVAWIEAHLKPRDFNGKPRRITPGEQAAAAMGRVLDGLKGRNERPPEPSGPGDDSPMAGRGDRPILEGSAVRVSDRTA